jgi:hypothetical protein
MQIMTSLGVVVITALDQMFPMRTSSQLLRYFWSYDGLLGTVLPNLCRKDAVCSGENPKKTGPLKTTFADEVGLIWPVWK